ncbi:hypothetical protein VitviT2T_027386 [Vitis vinifera]|uniref:Retrotransposon gag domain-containing protein n=1 Tax=Vitis vinifera TaxID=29760 RepID=A0ABY9DTN3_VITVI|nr:hypothetical protein VitviT2T_027386 [Vitis vinifera]
MTLDIGNDALMCKVFLGSLHGQALSWFHCFLQNFVNTLQDILEVFVSHYLCSVCQKQNISTLQNIKLQEIELLRDFMKRFKQTVLKVQACSTDAILQIFKRSFNPDTPFFESFPKKPPATMDDLFRRADKYFMLKDDV